MKTVLVTLALVFATAAKAAEPEAVAIITEVRSIVAAPDQWANLTAEIQKLDSLAKRCKERKKAAVEGFSRSLASYSAYFSDHPFTLSVDERAALAVVIGAYEKRFSSERERLLSSWRARPDQDHGDVDAASLALLPADHELEKCTPVFARHNSKKSRPNELAGVFIGVMREYGRLIASLTEEPIQLPETTRGK